MSGDFLQVGNLNLNRLLFVAICQQDFDGVQDCIEKGANVNCKLQWFISFYNHSGLQLINPLLLATNLYIDAINNNTETSRYTFYLIIKLLLDNGADPNAFHDMKLSPLHTVTFYMKFWSKLGTFYDEVSQAHIDAYYPLLPLFLQYKAVVFQSVLENILAHICGHVETPETAMIKTQMVRLILLHGSYIPNARQFEKISRASLQTCREMFTNWSMEMLLYCINYKIVLTLL